MDSVSRFIGTVLGSEFTWGIVGGLVTSVAGYLFAVTALAPKLFWSPRIIQNPSDEKKSGYKYQAKMENISYFRSLLDVEVTAYIRSRGLRGPRTITHLRIETTPLESGVLHPHGNRLVEIDPAKLTGRAEELLRESDHREIADDERRKLEDLLGLPQSYLVLVAVMTDGTTGRRFARESFHYVSGSLIQDRKFNPESSEIAEFTTRLWRRGKARRARSRRWRVKAFHPALQLHEPGD